MGDNKIIIEFKKPSVLRWIWLLVLYSGFLSGVIAAIINWDDLAHNSSYPGYIPDGAGELYMKLFYIEGEIEALNDGLEYGFTFVGCCLIAVLFGILIYLEHIRSSREATIVKINMILNQVLDEQRKLRETIQRLGE